jgi:ADP-heptose:LPS heptosyltransferase
MQKFLVIQTAFIGDVVLATGLVEKLRYYFPGAAIDFLVRKGNESLLAGHPFLNEVLVWDKKQGKLRNLWKLLRYIRKRKYSKVINVQRFAATGLLTAFSGAEETIGFDKNPLSFLFTLKVKHVISTSRAPKHEIERNDDLVKSFTGDKVFKPALYPGPQDFEIAAAYKQPPYICIAPSSVWFTKQYPVEKWIRFIQLLPAGYKVNLLGAPNDEALCADIIRLCPDVGFFNLCGKLSFLQSAALMKDAVMNYVNDSAPLHFASSVNAPVTAVYCSTVPSFGFGPLSAKSFIVQIKEPLYCRPCGLHGYRACPEGHFKCALEISDYDLLSTLRAPVI